MKNLYIYVIWNNENVDTFHEVGTIEYVSDTAYTDKKACENDAKKELQNISFDCDFEIKKLGVK